MTIVQGQQIDANRRTVTSNEAFVLASPWTFVTAGTGATGAHTLFTVTGTVALSVFGVCSTSLTGASTHEIGVAGNTAQLVAQIANTTTLDAGDVYTDADTEVGAGAIPGVQVVTDDVILTIGSTATTAGVVTYYCLWRPLSSDGNVTITDPA